VQALVFDKTGTLTVGKPAVTDFVPLVPESECTRRTMLQLLATAEATSEHPLAQCVSRV
jgi:Cu+-exporting ATPase